MAKIMVVDDDRDILEMVTVAFLSQGHEVVSARDGSEAEDILRRHRYDLVVTDLKMPRKGGIEVLKMANAYEPRVPVILISAYGEWPVYIEAMNLGAVDFVNKPFKIHELLNLAARVLAGSGSKDAGVRTAGAGAGTPSEGNAAPKEK